MSFGDGSVIQWLAFACGTCSVFRECRDLVVNQVLSRCELPGLCTCMQSSCLSQCLGNPFLPLLSSAASAIAGAKLPHLPCVYVRLGHEWGLLETILSNIPSVKLQSSLLCL